MKADNLLNYSNKTNEAQSIGEEGYKGIESQEGGPDDEISIHELSFQQLYDNEIRRDVKMGKAEGGRWKRKARNAGRPRLSSGSKFRWVNVEIADKENGSVKKGK